MFRFFVEEKEENYFLLTPPILAHLKVARIEKKQFICVYQSKFFLCKLENKKAKIIKEIIENHEFKNKVVLGAALINIKRFEWLIQKATELGVTDFYPIISTNISHKISGDINKKLIRWNTIALNAAEQSFRNNVMIVHKPTKFETIIKTAIPNKYLAHEKTSKKIIASFPTNSLFLTGPEGGFSEQEVEMARSNNFKIVSLGKRILRAETASLFMLARINE